MGKYEVTQREYEAVMGNNPSEFKGANLPVER
jgi:formylglycine-generating enzyme required for sulfatase activity